MGFKKRAGLTAGAAGERAWSRIERNSTSTNLRFDLGNRGVADVEEALNHVASAAGLYVSHITTLGRTRYPGNRHWHIKRHPAERGCLDLTHWPDGSLTWFTMRNSEPTWVHRAGHKLSTALLTRVSNE